MANRPTTMSQKELTGYAKAMQAAGVSAWTVDIKKPDGTRISLVVGDGANTARGADIDKMLGITNG
jgi:hypothetical protein